jgi:phenylalanyl-tRNA synthetase alpha chain
MDESNWLKEIKAAIVEAASEQDLEQVRIAWLGKKGRLTARLKGLAELPPDQRPIEGSRLNRLRVAFEEQYAARKGTLVASEESERLSAERLDMTLPGRSPAVGRLHPVNRVQNMIENIFLTMGYSLAVGPEVETVWYNFEALNVAQDHPARAMQDSFFIDIPDCVRRTQTSPMQLRAMEQRGGEVPLRIISSGRVYRRDEDATHLPMFTQLEVLAIDQGLGLADLKGTLLTMAQELFGHGTRIRLRPSYFPFTEPSLEVDISCVVCDGRGCRVCKDGWLEILGAGMVHPKVLTNGGYDPERVNGFALGMGIERVAMLLYGFDDIRLLDQNDMAFLTQIGDLARDRGGVAG